jgi:tRNA pseudouridine38-40 synthase
VASLDVEGGPPPERAAEALNAMLPDDVAVVAVEEAASDFHARHSARSRSYRYRLWTRSTPSPFERRRAYWYPHPLDEEALGEAAALVRGEHDFRAFTPSETEHEVFTRTVSAASWHRRGDALELEITADSFLRHMVRTLVGTMLERSPEHVAELLDGRARAVVVSRGSAGAEVHTSEGVIRRPAPAVTAVDTVGAGDALTAGFLSGLLDGLDPSGALERGVQAATFAVCTAGDWEGLPTRAELGLLTLDEGATVR